MGVSQFAIEKVQTFWDLRPCNVRHSPREIGTREYFDEVEARKYFVEPHIPTFAQFERWRGKRVLEIGCGIGTDTLNFARHGARVTAVDLSPVSLSIARRRAQVFHLDNSISFYRADAEELARWIPPEPFDLVYSFGVIHHTPCPDHVLDQVRNYTRPGATFKAMIYHRLSWKALSILLNYGHGKFWRLEELIAKHSEAQTGCPITYTYTRREARDLFERHGFRVLDIRIDHIFPYRVDKYVRYGYEKEWYFRVLPYPIFRWLERHLGWHLCVTAESY